LSGFDLLVSVWVDSALLSLFTQFAPTKITYQALIIIGVVCLAALGVLFLLNIFITAPQKSNLFHASTTRATKWPNTLFF